MEPGDPGVHGHNPLNAEKQHADRSTDHQPLSNEGLQLCHLLPFWKGVPVLLEHSAYIQASNGKWPPPLPPDINQVRAKVNPPTDVPYPCHEHAPMLRHPISPPHMCVYPPPITCHPLLTPDTSPPPHTGSNLGRTFTQILATDESSSSSTRFFSTTTTNSTKQTGLLHTHFSFKSWRENVILHRHLARSMWRKMFQQKFISIISVVCEDYVHKFHWKI